MKSEIAKREEAILAFWRERDIFAKTLAKPAPKGELHFYDGPPFATGLPHYGHILPGTVKDILPRFLTMRGYRILRRWGWDCHGLPVENLVEKELNLATKKEIEQFGIAAFNERARASVLRYEKEWQELIPRTGRWVDMAHAYRTMDTSYTDAVWWSFKTLFDRGLIYRGFKSMHLCPRCETTLSNFEVNQGYKDITDISVYVKLEWLDEPGTFFLAWTTTPWTLPGNVALAIQARATYVKAKKGSESFILLKNLAEKVLKNDFEIQGEFLGETLVGKKYKTLFPYYQNVGQIYAANFVSIEEGTGIVHIAPAFGEEDYQLSLAEKLPFIQHVGTDGRFKPEVKDFAGELVKPKDDHQATDIKIIKYLAAQNSLFAKEKIVHSYPHCWRCETPLLNYAASSWFLKVTEIKDQLLAENQKVTWMPEEIRDGRFGKWLEGARDWAISRSRYWGATLPVWQCPHCEKQKVMSGVEELKSLLPKSGNQYFLMRHGQSTANVTNRISSHFPDKEGLTPKGREEVLTAIEKLPAKIDAIYSSDFLRTRETAELVAQKLGFDPAKIIYDQRLREIDTGSLHGESWDKYETYFQSDEEHLTKSLPEGENVLAVKRRVMSLLSEIDQGGGHQKVLVISHGLPLYMMWLGAKYLSQAEIVSRDWQDHFAYTGEVRETEFQLLPHNQDYELDLHRPYIDEVTFGCECGNTMQRVPEVFDTWYDSGSVPFASTSVRELVPADFIAEGLDQTRGWFYTLLVLSTALFGQTPYHRVLVSGLILAEDGRKMSKRLNNYPELSVVLDRYGADALRYYLIASPAVRAEELAFSEKGLDEVVKKIILRLENVVAFYELYQTEVAEKNQTEHLLDRWIMARLAEVRDEVTAGLEDYQLDRVVRPLALFIDDLSTWYLRGSRKRPEALAVLRRVLLELSKLLAPFLPFMAEEIFQKLKEKDSVESVHLTSWPEPLMKDLVVLQEMITVRRLVSLGLERRATEQIKIRQPLGQLKLKTVMAEPYLELIKSELNVKAVIFDATLASEIEIDTTLTPELKAEGRWRDLVRLIQDERKKLKLKPGQLAELTINPDKKVIIGSNEDALKKICSISRLHFDPTCPTDSIILKV